ncbi:hypothetical protein DPMN_074929 [Dreissena polymorpha]|uniref:Uncharacterized protein n=1 Tax=Dreissena polymorpha TaxID=45954 RepID=A0A9D3YFW7_DREPO|nr:hypothetical protein DPMN_074929 [Dreissena polymorpha]
MFCISFREGIFAVDLTEATSGETAVVLRKRQWATLIPQFETIANGYSLDDEEKLN